MTMQFVKNALLNRPVFALAAALVFSAGSAARLDAGLITINFATAPGVDGTLTYVDNPATTNPARDIFSAKLVSPQYGNGTVLVANDFTNYANATGHADLATFTFASGTFSGAADSVINFANGSVGLTYTITSGTGAFVGAKGTLTESAQFTSLGNFSTGTPATAQIILGGGTLLVSPEPGTLAITTLGLGLLGWGYIRKRKQLRPSGV